jgi:DNA modification methylase
MNTEAPNKIIPTKWMDESQEKFNRAHYKNKDPFSRWAFMTKSCAQFNPGIAVQIYRKFQATHVFDPFAGWGDRCVAAMACNIKYTGCDSNPLLQEPFTAMIQKYPTQFLPTIHCPVRQENIQIPLSVDLVFSSPPFYTLKGKLMEKYDSATKDYHVFMAESLIPLRLRTDATIALHLPQNMRDDLTRYWGPEEEQISIGRRGVIYVWRSTSGRVDDTAPANARVHPGTE